MPGGGLAQGTEKGGRARDAAPAAHHRLDDDRGELLRVPLDERERGLGVVVTAVDHREGRVDGRAAVREGEHAAVIGAVEDEDVAAPGDRARGRERHQVALGAGIGEAHELEGGKALANQGRELRLVGIGAAERDAAVERALDRRR